MTTNPPNEPKRDYATNPMVGDCTYSSGGSCVVVCGVNRDTVNYVMMSRFRTVYSLKELAIDKYASLLGKTCSQNWRWKVSFFPSEQARKVWIVSRRNRVHRALAHKIVGSTIAIYCGRACLVEKVYRTKRAAVNAIMKGLLK